MQNSHSNSYTAILISNFIYHIASGKVWQVESLANLANRLQFAKLKPSKLVLTINDPLVIHSFAKLFSTKHLKRANSPNILPAKLSHYMVNVYKFSIQRVKII